MQSIKKTMLLLVVLLVKINTQAQFLQYAKPIIDSLCAENMHGRGYVQNGVNIAANYLAKQYQSIGLQPFGSDYFQDYSFDINTFPTAILCTADCKKLEAGNDFLLSPDATFFDNTVHLLPFSISNKTDVQLLFTKLKTGLQANETILFKNCEDAKQYKTIIDSIENLQIHLPLYAKTSSKKLLWSTSQQTKETPTIIFTDSVANNIDNLRLVCKNEKVNNFPCKNIIGYLPTTKKNRNKPYIVITAHYDHLGMLGNKAYFAGASDNASGTSMLLSLAHYFATSQPKFPIVFILFSGEEVGLLGSKYFVEHPLFPLNKIKMLVNIDIMGSADQGITVVNGETEKKAFDLLTSINTNENLLPAIKIRGKTANSDHYHFAENGVPSIFIYSLGGPGWYHDVWDKPSTLTYKNFDNVGKLLVKFIEGY